jgi:prefoldin subunit 4
MLETATTRLDEDTSELEDKLGSIRDQMKELKVQLYARFGKQINLET